MDFDFEAENFNRQIHEALSVVAEKLSPGDSKDLDNLFEGLRQSVDVIVKADVDLGSTTASGRPMLDKTDVTQIGEYTLSLLEGVVSLSRSAGLDDGDLLDLSVPVALWVARNGGRLDDLELVVNALSAYANVITQTQELSRLAGVLREIIDAASDDVRRDLEQSNTMRPWRVLNINYGIVATRSHDPELIDEAYAELVKNLPQDARQFFREGMQQMDIVGYPEHVREVVRRYDEMWGSDSTLH